MKWLRRPLAILASLSLVIAVQAVDPAPAAAACYYGSWKTSDFTHFKENLRIRSVVVYRLGYTCGGSTTGEYEIDYRKMWIDVYDGGWMGYTRDWMAYHVYDALNDPADYRDPNQVCAAAECHFYKPYWHNVWGNGSDPYVYAFCWSCTPTGFANLFIEHHFVTAKFYAWYE